MIRLPDYHTHTYRCGHARGTASEYVEAARRLGLPAIGVCDHLPLPGHRDPALSMDIDDLSEYVGEVQELKRAYPGYVLLGVEADYEPSSFDEVKAILASHPFDYVIGSVHFVDGWGFDDPRQRHSWDTRDVDEVYRRYFDLVGEAAETGAFTLLGHIDLVKKFGHRPRRPLIEAARTMVGRIADSGVAVEVNTAGLRTPVSEIYPDSALLSLLRNGGVPVTFGSDAHTPDDVGRDFHQALAHVRAAGYDDYVTIDPSPSSASDSAAKLRTVPLPEADGAPSPRAPEVKDS